MRLRFLWALLLAGCASDEKTFQESISHLRPVEVPTFLNADFAKSFGAQDFSARVEVKGAGAGAVSGEIFGHGGNLFYSAGKVGALWDGASGVAYLLND